MRVERLGIDGNFRKRYPMRVDTTGTAAGDTQ